MALPARKQLIYWGIAAAVLFWFLWVLGGVLLPFVLGAAFAYLLDPIADRLQRLGMSRLWATITITVLAIIGVVATLLLVVPQLVEQASGLIKSGPELLHRLEVQFPDLFGPDSPVRRSLDNIGGALQERGGEVANRVLTSALTVLNVLVLVVLVPVITFYLLMDWDRMVAHIDSLLPRQHAPTIRRLARQIDRTLAGFVRGQALVCLILGTYYAVMLMLVGLNFGLVVGAIAGALTFIPYVGALVGGVLAIGLALVQFWGDWMWVVAVWAIFQSGQFVEGNFLTPKLVGDRVSLHPVWLIFALSVFGALFGFLGLLVAVPAAAAIGVLARFGIEKYRESTLYRGREGRPDAP